MKAFLTLLYPAGFGLGVFISGADSGRVFAAFFGGLVCLILYRIVTEID